jgi:imidazolonepropionase-like amidohydrolase
MSAADALRAATITPAPRLATRRTGRLEPQAGHLVVIDADVLADIYQSDRVSYVMLNGRCTRRRLNEGHRRAKDQTVFLAR